MEHKLYKIKWLDSTNTYGWVSKDEIKPECLEVDSIGYLIGDYLNQIVVTSHIAEFCVNAPVSIPKVAILSMEEIKNG